MLFVFVACAAGCLVGAYRCRDDAFLRNFLIGCCALNVFAFGLMASDAGWPHKFGLIPAALASRMFDP